jgi:hypothetical protein
LKKKPSLKKTKTNENNKTLFGFHTVKDWTDEELELVFHDFSFEIFTKFQRETLSKMIAQVIATILRLNHP